jgi:hypothetical protein
VTTTDDVKGVLGGLVLEDDSTWAESALDWQREDAEAVLAAVVTQANRRTRREVVRQLPRWHYWLRGRGMSKTTDAAAVLLCLLLVLAPKRSRSYCFAVDERQAALLLDAFVGLAERSGLLGLFDIGARSVTVKATGATLSVESSDSASAFGTRPWAVVVDEFALWADTDNSRRLWASIISGLGKVSGSRLLVLSSAGAPGSLAHKVWEAAKVEDHWRTSLQPGPSPFWSTEDTVATQTDLLPAEWRRFILCEFAEADDSLATADDVAACVGNYRVREPVRGTRYVMALDIGTRRDSTVLTVGHTEAHPTGRKVVIDRVYRWTGTHAAPVSLDEVETALLAAWRSYGRPRLVYDFHQAAQLVERLKRAGVLCDEFVFSTSSVNRLARSLFAALRDRALVLPDDEELLAELSRVRLIETGPGLVRLDHRSGEHDDQAVTVAMVTASLLDRPTGGGRIHVATGDQPPIRLVPDREKHEPPPAVVKPGEERPTDKLLHFRNARRHANYQGPGRWQRP